MSDFDNLIPGWFKTIVQVGNDLIWSQYFWIAINCRVLLYY